MAPPRRATSDVRSLPSSPMGRTAGWLLLVGVVLAFLNTVAILPFTESRTGLDALQGVVNALAGGCLVAAGVGGVAAVVGRRERSWVLLLAIAVLVLVVVLMGSDLLAASA